MLNADAWCLKIANFMSESHFSSCFCRIKVFFLLLIFHETCQCSRALNEIGEMRGKPGFSRDADCGENLRLAFEKAETRNENILFDKILSGIYGV